MTKKILFFDCETNGLPIDYKASYTAVDNWSRVISLAWILADESGLAMVQGHYLIKPDGWEISPDSFAGQNGFTQKKNEQDGRPIREVLNEFYETKTEADILVAHNLNFDHRIVWAEFIRAGMQPRSGMEKICTMMKGMGVAKLPKVKGGGYKWPKLEELHFHLFGRSFEGAHDALGDVTACKDCFFEMVKRGALSLEIPLETK